MNTIDKFEEHVCDSQPDAAERFAGYDRGDQGCEFDEYLSDEDLIRLAAYERACGC
jgi:hypothetical protein